MQSNGRTQAGVGKDASQLVRHGPVLMCFSGKPVFVEEPGQGSAVYLDCPVPESQRQRGVLSYPTLVNDLGKGPAAYLNIPTEVVRKIQFKHPPSICSSGRLTK